MATALGDADLVRRLLDADPGCVRTRVSDEYFPMVGPRSGGTIYQWELGWHVSAHQVARKFGHPEIFQLLMERTPADEMLLVACWLHDEALADRLLKEHGNLAATLPAAGRRHAAHAARNNDMIALRLMLAAGLPVDARSQHGATPLHWAAWHGNPDMAALVLRYRPPLEQTDEDFKATPLGWAIHGSEHSPNCKSGDFAGVVRALLHAGAKAPEKVGGSPPVREELRRHGVIDRTGGTSGTA
jgi:hypothetical protein